MKHEEQIIFSDEKSAESAVKAVSVELNNFFEKRSKTTITTNKNVVSLKIDAEDDSSLKASLSSYSRLIELCKKISKTNGGNKDD